MKTRNGVLIMTKREIKDIRLLIHHAKRDISYGVGGSFGDGEKMDEREIKKVELAIENLEWIISLQEK